MSHTLRRPFRKSRRFDRTCRSNGGCPYCYGNRMHRVHRHLARAVESFRDWLAEVRP